MPGYPLVLVRPPRHPRALVRSRLAAWPGRGAGVVLVGPSGSGKTVAALQLAGAREARLAWCRMAVGYATASDLVGIAATSCGLDPPSSDDPVVLADGLLQLLEAEPTVLVVDDYHLADGATCDPLLAEVLALLPAESRVVLTSQVRPAGLLGRLPAGLVDVVDGDDLAFTSSEAIELFEASGRPADAVETWLEGTRGWAAALAVAAESSASSPATTDLGAIVEEVVLSRLDPETGHALDALAVLPYLDPTLAGALELGNRDVLERLARHTSLVIEAGTTWRLHNIARDTIGRRVPASTAASWRRAAAATLAATDPATAVDLYLAAGDDDDAADLLAAAASAIGPERATAFAYRLPAPLRRRLPPVLTAGRATVDLDAASEAALARVAAASTEEERAEALLALASARAGAGDLPAALESYEAVAGRHDGPRADIADAWLGIVRWWAGDLDGARAALAGARDTVWSCWARGHVALIAGERDEAVARAGRAIGLAADDNDATIAPGASLLAACALVADDVDAAEKEAIRADAAGEAAGGFDLACGALAVAWVRARQGRADDALAACSRIERRVGRHDHHARLGAALVRLAVADTTEDRERGQRRVRDLRRSGFAPVEALARMLLPSLDRDTSGGLRVELLAPGAIDVDGEGRGDGWRSRKAVEVLRFLALAGQRGATREQAIEAVWPGREADKGRTLLRTALSEIRRVLEPDRQPGEPSRFLRADGERIVLDAACDVVEARALAAEGDWRRCFEQVERPLVDLEAAGEWAEELHREIARLRVDAAEHVATPGDGGDGDDHGDEVFVRALGVLIDAEPWRRDLYDRLAALHRRAGDEAAARAVERRWFEDET